MGYFARLVHSLRGKGKYRLADELALLGAPPELVEEARSRPDVEQEQLFIGFAEGKHACMLDWRAERDEIYDELLPLLSPEEKELLPRREDLPEDASTVIASLERALSRSNRRLFHEESFGDFSFLVLVPKEKAAKFVECVGPWLIPHEA
jgi:hypothetical protein